MRVIKSGTDLETYQEIFMHVESDKSLLVVWQLLANGERRISQCGLTSFQTETQSLRFKAPSKEIDSSLPLYFYSVDGQFIFKAEILELTKESLVVALPSEIKILDEGDTAFINTSIGSHISTLWKTTGLMGNSEIGPDFMRVKSMSERTSRDQDFLNNEFNSLSLDEEDKLFADKRESPRARPKVDKWVKVISEVDGEVHLLKLHDLSRGGIGFISLEPHLFPKGSKVLVVGFTEFDLDDPMYAKVMSHRAVDETEIEHKIGCKFDEGQD